MSERYSDGAERPKHPEYSVPPWAEPLPDDDGGGLFARKGKLIVAAAVMLGALGYFAYMAFQSATVYSYSVSELNALGPTPQGKLVRVNGSLVQDSFARADASTIAQFALTDGAQSAQAQYAGVLPDLFFNPHSEIILEGAYGADGVFMTQNVLVKCPSKYIALDEDSEQPDLNYAAGDYAAGDYAAGSGQSAASGAQGAARAE